VAQPYILSSDENTFCAQKTNKLCFSISYFTDKQK